MANSTAIQRRGALAMLILACQGPPLDEPLPAIIAEGERVRVATEVVDQVRAEHQAATADVARLTRQEAELTSRLGAMTVGGSRSVTVGVTRPSSSSPAAGVSTSAAELPAGTGVGEGLARLAPSSNSGRTPE